MYARVSSHCTILLCIIDRIDTFWNDNILIRLLYIEEEGCHIRLITRNQSQIDIAITRGLVIDSHIISDSIGAIYCHVWFIKIQVGIVERCHFDAIVHCIATDDISFCCDSAIRSHLYYHSTLLYGVVLPLVLRIDEGATCIEVIAAILCTELTKHTIVYECASHLISEWAERDIPSRVWCVSRQGVIAKVHCVGELNRHLNLDSIYWSWCGVPQFEVVLNSIKANYTSSDSGGIATLEKLTLNVSYSYTRFHRPVIDTTIVKQHIIHSKLLTWFHAIDSDTCFILLAIDKQLKHMAIILIICSDSRLIESYFHSIGRLWHFILHINRVPFIVCTISIDMCFPTLFGLRKGECSVDRRLCHPCDLI